MAKFCGKCGAKLDEQGKCPKCHKDDIVLSSKKRTPKFKKIIFFLISLLLISIIVVSFSFIFIAVQDNNKNRDKTENLLYTPDENSIAQDEKTGILYVDNIILVFFKENTSDNDVQRIVKAINGEIVGYMPVIDQYQIKIAKSSLEEIQAICLDLKSEDCVIEAIYDTAFQIDENSLICPDDPWTKKWYTEAEEWNEANPSGANWWLEAIQAQSAWEYNDKLDSIKIGVVDNGFDTGHQDLKNIISYVNPVNNKAEHGTHVAGIIAAEANNNKGISGIVWDCDLITWDWELNVPQKIVNNVFNLGWSTSNQILGGTVELIEKGAKVINLSAGQTASMTGLTRTEADINSQGYSASLYLHALLVRGYDFVIVQSSGNGNSQGQSVDSIYNGLYSSINNDNCFTSEKIGADEIIGRIIVVGAAQNEGNNKYSQTSWSNAGDRVDICAPGNDIYSTIPGGISGKYGYLSGTSMSAPVVTGVASLVWAANNALTGIEVKQIICTNTTYTVEDNTSANHSLINTYQMVNAKLSVQAALNYRSTNDNSNNIPVVTSDERDIVLVLDNSGSMSGTPIQETKKASEKFIETILKEDASIGIVKYESSADMISNFSMDENQLKGALDELYASGGTNILSGLTLANEMLQQSNAKKQIIVLMSDGLPSNSHEELIDYAEELRKKGIIIYTLGFFEAVSSYDKVSAQSLMEGMASEGCHYEVADADSLVYFFGDVADQISGQKYIYIRIACPVDVTVKYRGETLCSDVDDLSTRTSFGSLTFEENTENSDGNSTKDDRVKILRLKEGTEYDIHIEGTGRGRMNYTIGFMDEDGEYSDLRKFYNIKITNRTVIDTVASNTSTTLLEVDEDGDGKYDLQYKAKENSRGEIVETNYIWFIVGGVSLIAIIAIAISIVVIKKKKSLRACLKNDLSCII